MASNRPAKGGIVDDKTRLELYRVMVLSRTYEEAILREYHADKKPAFDIRAGLVPGEMHLSAGQEPAAAGVCAHLRRDDAVTATHRPHHIAIAHGVDLGKMTAEISVARPGWAGAGAGTCTCSIRRPISPARALSPRGCRPRPGRRSRSSGREAAGWRSRSPARGPPTRAHSTSH